MSMLDTVPPVREQGPNEVQPLIVDFADNLEAGETIAQSEAKLVDQLTGADYSATGLGMVGAQNARLLVTVQALVAGRSYDLRVKVTTSSGAIWETRTVIVCVP